MAIESVKSCFIYNWGLVGNFQLKLLFVKIMLDALFLSNHELHLFNRINKCTIPMIFHIIVGNSIASCYIVRGALLHHTGHIVTSLLQQQKCGSQSMFHSYMSMLLH